MSVVDVTNATNPAAIGAIRVNDVASIRSLSVAPNGKHIYVPSYNTNGIAVVQWFDCTGID